jgi:YidC/Oxa1 family membrane protein insertase
MDRSTIIGFVLIGLILMVWMWMQAPPPPKPGAAGHDSVAASMPAPRKDTAASAEPKPAAPEDTLGAIFSGLAGGREAIVAVETDLYRARISTRGAGLVALELKNYTTWDGHPLNLVNPGAGSDLSALFYTSEGKLVNTKTLLFETAAGSHEITVHGEDSVRLEFTLKVRDGSRIVKSYIFSGSSYAFDVAYRFEGMQSILSNYEYQVAWESGMKFVERNSVDEASFAAAYAFSGGELSEIDATSLDAPVKSELGGRVAWVATRNKYFGMAMMARDQQTIGAYLQGERRAAPDHGVEEYYKIALKLPFLGKPVEESRLRVFMGPLDFSLVKSQNVELERIVSLGAAWIIRPIAEYVMLPLFHFLHLLIPNYGIVIIIFAFIIKIALHPLTKTQLKSMQRMQALQPMIEEIRTKHKEDPQKMNQQVMRLYQEYGVNPMGGCLPLILQLPILYALWAVFRSTIELRHASFVWWINDLSIPDVIATLPFPIPIFGIHEISGLAVLMGVTMFLQQKMSVKDPRQKMMVWMMPILFTLLFMGFPSGLNLYYLVFNILSVAQQQRINKQHQGEPLVKVPQKKQGGIFAKIAKNLPDRPR